MLTLPNGIKITHVLLDRDGVINQDSSDFIRSPKDLVFINDSIKTIVGLQKAGLSVAICTNQSGIARGLLTLDDLYKIHLRINLAIVENDGVPLEYFFCPHHPNDNCNCRKPQPGLLNQALSFFNADSRQTIFIGDRESDVKAAHSANCHSGLIQEHLSQPAMMSGVYHIGKLADILCCMTSSTMT